MARLVWDKQGEKLYQTGVDQGVLYVQKDNGEYEDGKAWNGLTNVTESPSGAERTPLYANNAKYVTMISAEEFGGTIEAYTSPEEFDQCDGSASIATGVSIGQQSRRAFGLAYRTQIGNDTQSNAYGYKIHLVYGCLCSPTEKSYATINDSPEATSLSWEYSATPVPINAKKADGSSYRPTATVVIDSTKVGAEALAKLEKKIFGGDGPSENATLPTPDEILEILAA